MARRPIRSEAGRAAGASGERLGAGSGRFPLGGGGAKVVDAAAFARFLDVAKIAGVPVSVVTDNDGDYDRKVHERYRHYESDLARICASADNSLPTLEDHLFACNGLLVLNRVFGTEYACRSSMMEYMKANKTEWALKLFDTKEKIIFPEYVRLAVKK